METKSRRGRKPLPDGEKKERRDVVLSPATLRRLSTYARPNEPLGQTIDRFVGEFGPMETNYVKEQVMSMNEAIAEIAKTWGHLSDEDKMTHAGAIVCRMLDLDQFPTSARLADHTAATLTQNVYWTISESRKNLTAPAWLIEQALGEIAEGVDMRFPGVGFDTRSRNHFTRAASYFNKAHATP